MTDPLLRSKTRFLALVRATLPFIAGAATAAATVFVIDSNRDGSDARREREAREDAVLSLPVVTESIDPVLGIPARVNRPNNAFLRPFSPSWRGTVVRYNGQIFSPNAQELIWIPALVDGKHLLRWQTTDKGSPGLQGIFPGNELELLDNNLYDFGVGALFVKVRSRAVDVTGYTLLETIIGETEVVGDKFRVAKDADRFRKTTTVDIKGLTLYAPKIPNDRTSLATFAEIFNDPGRYEKDLSGGSPGGVHPVFAISAAYGMLLQAYSADISPGERDNALRAAVSFVDNYLEPMKVAVGSGAVSWSYGFDWTVNWGIKLSPPWYSAYANANAAAFLAVLYHLTEDERYKRLAREAAAYLSLPIDAGGSEYDISGFKYPAEYVYLSPPLPNIRVLDGELISVLAFYNAARLLGDGAMLRIAYRQMASLAMALEYYRQSNGNLYFAYYIEEMPEHYKWQVWSALQVLALVAKDSRFSEAAKAMLANVPVEWCEANGC